MQRFLKKIEFSPTNCSSSIEFSSDALTLTMKSTTGFKTVTCTHSLTNGYVYYELELKSLGHCRIGLVEPGFCPYAPIGYDSHGYSIGNEGYIFHNNKRYTFSRPLQKNDIIGVFVRLNNEQPEIRLNDNLSESLGTGRERPNKGFMRIYLNAEDAGVAFYNLAGLVFTPAVSLTEGTEIVGNYGPYFAFPNHISDNLL